MSTRDTHSSSHDPDDDSNAGGEASQQHVSDSQRLKGDKHLTDSDFYYLCRLVYELSRIHLGPHKKELVAARVRKRLRHLRLNSYAEYRAYLQSGRAEAETECQELIDVVSTNFTSFLREQKHFDVMRERILPEWLARRSASFCAGATAVAAPSTFRAWSAACATGEETYSIAVVLAESFRQMPQIQWYVEASDISSRVLRWARRGIYEDSRLDVVPQEWVRRHFDYGTASWEGHLRVGQNLRQHVNFHHHNLLQPPYPFAGNFDLIFCRNVMIYFDAHTQAELIRHLTSQLAPGGWLLTGHAETLMGIEHTLERVEPSIYRKPHRRLR
ncbi:MAG: protein-glutamate O-methyltransferase CheR [Candidatus Methylacidiphilales bacterium]|nr:protein-glutamate O-methyltransferase CheR [Candidatus Methylacidiphilales bacterium]